MFDINGMIANLVRALESGIITKQEYDEELYSLIKEYTEEQDRRL